MRTRLIIMISSFLICIATCVFSNLYVGDAMNTVIKEAEKMETYLAENQTKDAFQSAEKLEKQIDQKQQLLEGLVPHEDLHDLSVQITDTALSIKIGDLDDCKKALALMKENAEHLIKHEAFLLGNIF